MSLSSCRKTLTRLAALGACLGVITAYPMSRVTAATAPSAPVIGGAIRILADNDFALLAGDDDNVTRMILQNDAVWMDQEQQAATYYISLNPDETYLYLLAMGGGGGEDIGGRLNGVDITQIAPGPNGIQRAVSKPGGLVDGGYLLVSQYFSDWSTIGLSGDTNINAEWGKYAPAFADIRTALTGATWGNPPPHQEGGVGSFITGKAFNVPSQKAVMFRFKGTSLGGGLVTAGDTTATVAWNASTSDGGSPILDYTATAYRTSDNVNTGRSCTTPNGSTTSCVVTGLTNGVSYYFKISARNAIGSSSLSNATAAVTPSDTTAPTLTLSAATTSQTTNNAVFTVSGNESIDCATLSATNGVDLSVTGGTLSSVTHTSASVCSVAVTTSVAAGASADVTVTRASSFSVDDVAGNAQTSLAGSPRTVTVSIPAIPTAAPSNPTTTTAPVSVEIVVQAPTTTVAQAVSTAGSRVTPRRSAAPGAATTTATDVTQVSVPVVDESSDATDTAVTSTTAPVVPSVPRVQVGEAAVESDGEQVPSTLSRRDNQIIVTAGDINAVIGGINDQGEVAALDADGNIRLQPGSAIRLTVKGFEPNTEVEVWLFSTPTKLGSATIDQSGTLRAEFTVPEATPVGAHRLAISAKSKDGEITTLAVGLNIGDAKKERNISTWLIVLPISAAVIGALVMPAVTRRRRSAQESR